MIIETAIEYEAALSLGRFLRKLGLSKGSLLVAKVAREYSDDFESCGRCDHPKCECTCDDDGYRNYDVYNDEASFE
jgi:hypothetical protein